MRALLLWGALALCVLLPASSHPFSSGSNGVKRYWGTQREGIDNTPDTPDVGALELQSRVRRDEPTKTRQPGRRKKCPGCYSPLGSLEAASLQQLLNDEPAPQERQREKHHKKEKKGRRGNGRKGEPRILSGVFSPMGRLPTQDEPAPQGRQREKHGKKDKKGRRGNGRKEEVRITAGSFSAMGLAPPREPKGDPLELLLNDEPAAQERHRRRAGKKEKRDKGGNGRKKRRRGKSHKSSSQTEPMPQVWNDRPGYNSPVARAMIPGQHHEQSDGGDGKHERRHRGEEQRRGDPTPEEPEESVAEGGAWNNGRRHRVKSRGGGRKRGEGELTPEHPEGTEREGRYRKHGRHRGEEGDVTPEGAEPEKSWRRGHRHHRSTRREERKRRPGWGAVIASELSGRNRDAIGQKE